MASKPSKFKLNITINKKYDLVTVVGMKVSLNAGCSRLLRRSRLLQVPVGRRSSLLGRPQRDQVVNAHRVRTVGQEALVGSALLVCIRESDPKKDLPFLNCLLEMCRVSRHQPISECFPQGLGTSAEPLRKASGQWTRRATDWVSIARKRQRLNIHE
jgi:hypothetical protein